MAKEVSWNQALRSITGRIRSSVRHHALTTTLEEMKRPGCTVETSEALVRARDALIAAIEAEFTWGDE